MWKTPRMEVVCVEYFWARGHFAAVFPLPPDPQTLGFGGIWTYPREISRVA